MATGADITYTKCSDNPSLGGVTAISTIVGTLHELFDPISPAQAASGYTDYRLIAVRNANASDTLDGMKIYLSSETTSTSTTLEIGVKDGLFGFTPSDSPTWPDALANELTAPAGVTFHAATSIATSVSLGDIPSHGTKIVYLKRIVTAGAAELSNDIGTIKVTNRVS